MTIQTPASPKTPKAASARMQRLVVSFMVFCSGMAGLIYELSWSRQIGLLFGHTAQAAAVVLGCYFAGMALGYLGATRILPRIQRPLRGYAIAEWIVALWAFVTPWLLQELSSPTWASWLNASHPALQTLLRVFLAFVLLLPATAALGSTLPFVAEFLSPARNSTTRWVTRAYAWNTTGAVVGVFATTGFLLLHVGVQKSSYVAAGLSLLCGFIAWWVGQSPTLSVEETPSDSDNHTTEAPLVADTFWLTLAGISGLSVLALEVLYARLFALVFHNSTYTFGLVLAACLVGLSVSANLASWMADKWSPSRLATYFCIFGAFSIAHSVIVFDRVTQFRYFEKGDTFAEYLSNAFGLVSLVVMPVMLVLGLLLPLAWKATRHQHSAGQVVGKLTAINTIAATAGALLASFVLLPWLGLWGSFALLALGYLAVGAWLAWKTKNRVAQFLWLPTFVALGFALLLPQEKYGLRKNEVIVKRWNSPYGWIDVAKNTKTGNLRLRQDIHYGMGSSHSKVMELRQGHMPLLMHPNPQQVLFIGLATGITASSALYHPEVKHTSVVELIPEVLLAAGLFQDHNKNILEHDKVTIYNNDGRHFLAATAKKFDVIVSDLFVPWQSQTGYLYTLEHYKMAYKRLKKGGLFCQWLALWQVSQRELEMIANTFAAVFPRTTLWFSYLYPDHAILGIVGSKEPIQLPMHSINRRLTPIMSQSSPVDYVLTSATRMMHLYLGDWHRQPKQPLNRDENPRIEFLAPISHWQGQRVMYQTLKKYIRGTLFRLPRKHVIFQPSDGTDTPPVSSSHKWLMQQFNFKTE